MNEIFSLLVMGGMFYLLFLAPFRKAAALRERTETMEARAAERKLQVEDLRLQEMEVRLEELRAKSEESATRRAEAEARKAEAEAKMKGIKIGGVDPETQAAPEAKSVRRQAPKLAVVKPGVMLTPEVNMPHSNGAMSDEEILAVMAEREAEREHGFH